METADDKTIRLMPDTGRMVTGKTRLTADCRRTSGLVKVRSMLPVLLSVIVLPYISHGHSLKDHHQQIDEVVELVEEHFYDSVAVSGPEWKNAVRQLHSTIDTATGLDQPADKINSLLGILNTSHTHYYAKGDPKRYQLLGVFSPLYDQSREDLFCYDGIGIDTRRVKGGRAVISVYDGFPAQKAGLRFGDRILSVDNTVFHPIESFKGKAGRKAHIKIKRNGDTASITVPVVKIDGRTMFKDAAEASVRVLDHFGKKVGYIHLWSYAGTQYQELLRQNIIWGELSTCDALVLDLRDGWGGADLSYLNLFRPPIVSTSFRGRDGTTGTYSGAWEKPVTLLVNERSTSGKELFAYGFIKSGMGPVVGARTAGAVMAGRIFLLSNGDVLYLAVRDVTVDGVRLEGEGVAPDITAPRSVEAVTDLDAQLQTALDEVVKLLKKNAVDGNG